MAKTVIFFSHPQIEASNVNAYLIKAFKTVPDVKVIHLDEKKTCYPFCSDLVADYQADMLAADNIVLAFPVWWYTAPGSMSNFISSAFSYGFAYSVGAAGELEAGKLAGKKLHIIATLGGTEADYAPGSKFGQIKEFLNSYELVASSCGLEFKGYHTLFGCETGKKPMNAETEEKFRNFFEACKASFC